MRLGDHTVFIVKWLFMGALPDLGIAPSDSSVSTSRASVPRFYCQSQPTTRSLAIDMVHERLALVRQYKRWLIGVGDRDCAFALVLQDICVHLSCDPASLGRVLQLPLSSSGPRFWRSVRRSQTFAGSVTVQRGSADVAFGSLRFQHVDLCVGIGVVYWFKLLFVTFCTLDCDNKSSVWTCT